MAKREPFVVSHGLLRDLQDASVRQRLYGPRTLRPDEVETDRRRQKGVVRGLVEAGYLATAEEGRLSLTGKAYDEIEAEELDLIREWDAWRAAGNNRHGWDFLPFRWLGRGQKKAALDAPEAFSWHLADAWSLSTQNELREGGLFGPAGLPLAEGLAALQKQAAAGKHRGCRDMAVVIGSAALSGHVRATLEAERFEEAFRGNLPWGLAALGVVGEEDAQLVKAGAGKPGDPGEWGEKLAQDAADLEETVARYQARLDALRKALAGVEALGGWDEFRDRMRAVLRLEMTKQE